MMYLIIKNVINQRNNIALFEIKKIQIRSITRS